MARAANSTGRCAGAAYDVLVSSVSARPPHCPAPLSPAAVYWTAFIGLFFDYYDLYLFVYLEKLFAHEFALSVAQSNALQFTGLAGVGLGALIFGYLADRHGRGRMMLWVFGVYGTGIAGICVAWSYESLLVARAIASLALGAEWGISHAFMAEHVSGARRYRFAALLQFSILGGLLAALASRYAVPTLGWRWMFAASLPPIALLAFVRWRFLAAADRAETRIPLEASPAAATRLSGGDWVSFAQCFCLASLTIASGTVNIFFAKELPQSPAYTVLFWVNVAPGMLFGAWVVRRLGVRTAIGGYAFALLALSAFAWASTWPGRKLAFALVLPFLNGIPFGLMGAYFNEVFSRYRTMLSGAAYNLGRILAGFAPVLVAALGLHRGGNYFLFTAGLAVAVLTVGLTLEPRETRDRT